MTWSVTQRCEFDEFDTKSVVLHIFARLTATWVEASRSKKRSIPVPATLTLLDAGGLEVGTEPEDRGWSGEHSPAWTIYRACRTAAAISAMKGGPDSRGCRAFERCAAARWTALRLPRVAHLYRCAICHERLHRSLARSRCERSFDRVVTDDGKPSRSTPVVARCAGSCFTRAGDQRAVPR